MEHRRELAALIDQKSAKFFDISDQIWGFAEPRFQEEKSAALHVAAMKAEGFAVRQDLAGEATAFIAEYGSGSPVIAILGEYDALSGLSQEADNPVQTPIIPGGQGHGCGHQALGVGAAMAAVAVKDYLSAHALAGTVRFYGCPAEENAGGKAYLVRDGFFSDVDIALTWHPFGYSMVPPTGSLANFRVFYTFRGQSAHAAGWPHLGRSALDAAVLMDVGVNYMREHMIDQARIHGAFTNSGGTAPNVIPAEAQVLYAMRAPKVTQVKELYDRLEKIARGAAMMTETSVEIKQVSAYSDYIANEVICQRYAEHMEQFIPIDYSAEELEYAAVFKAVAPELDRKNARGNLTKALGREKAAQWLDAPITNCILPRTDLGTGSTDVGDVSWVVPTAHVYVNCYAAATPMHSWQAVAQGKSSILHKGTAVAAKILACTALDFLTDPALVAKARESWLEDLGGEVYPNPLPADARPEIW